MFHDGQESAIMYFTYFIIVKWWNKTQGFRVELRGGEWSHQRLIYEALLLQPRPQKSFKKSVIEFHNLIKISLQG